MREPGSVAGATQAGEPVGKMNSSLWGTRMREEKSEELVPLDRAPGIREWRPDEILLDGECEARPCPGCRTRLKVDETALGRMLPCPRCGALARVLAAAGPFAALPLDAPPIHRPAPPIELVPAVPNAPAMPPEAPVVPSRRLDPIDERSPMVDAVARLQWVGGAFLLAVVVQQLGTLWKREHVSENEELTVYLTAALRIVLAGLLFLASGGLNARKKAAWAFGLVLSIAIVAGECWLFQERSTDQPGYRARFDYGVLLELPTLLIALFSLVVLATPRYAAEFLTAPRQSGTIDVPRI